METLSQTTSTKCPHCNKTIKKLVKEIEVPIELLAIAKKIATDINH